MSQAAPYKESVDAFNLFNTRVSLHQVSQDSFMLSHHQHGPADEATTLDHGRNNLQASIGT